MTTATPPWMPADASLPFFTYELFRPGEIAHFHLRELVGDARSPVAVQGTLKLRDGLPLLVPDGGGRVWGDLVRFAPGREAAAYARIHELGPWKQYSWQVVSVDGQPANALVGVRPERGCRNAEEPPWSSWRDPLFVEAPRVVAQTLDAYRFGREVDASPTLQLQMAYGLLWACVERYAAFRYGFGSDEDSIRQRLVRVALEDAFITSLTACPDPPEGVYQSNDPSKDAAKLERTKPKKAIDFFYRVRSNAVHRGKVAGVKDFRILRYSLTELHRIFEDVWEAAKAEAAV